MTGFAVRNLKVFFKDRAAVLFSLFAVFVIIGLYALFLGDVWVSGNADIPGVRYLMDSWIMAGLLSVTSVTTTMGAFGTMVADKVDKISKDFTASPISSRSIAGGYVLSAILIGIIMSLITFVLAEIYIVASGGALMNAITALKTVGMIVLSTVTNTSLVLFIVSFFESANAFAAASTVIGTIIGFITGIYLPVGELSEGVQMVVKCFPVSHAAALFRQIMMEAPMSESFAGAPAPVVEEFKQMMGVTFKFGDTTVTPTTSILILLGSAAVFYALAIVNLSRKRVK